MSKRVYVHFLGYSDAEGGIQEIITSNTFNLGSIDLETGEREFDEIEFDVPLTDILKVKPVSDNYAGTLMTTLSSTVTDESNPLSYPVRIVDLDEIIGAGDLLWIENERVECVYNFSTASNYTLRRNRNGSIRIQHLSEYIEDDIDCLTITQKRLSPIGLIVKVFTNEKVLAYGQLTSVSRKNTGLVTCKCKNLYEQEEPIYINEPNLSTRYNYLSLVSLANVKANEFFALLEVPSLALDFSAAIEQIPGTTWFKVDKPKDFVNQILTINNSFLKFENGTYKWKSLSRKVKDEYINSRLLTQSVVAGGTVDFEIQPPYGSVSVENNLSDEPYVVRVNDSNFTRSSTGGKTLSLDLKAVQFDGNDVSAYDSIVEIAQNKLFMLNNIVELMTITAPKNSEQFEIGAYYKFLDIGKHKTFYDSVTDNVFFCYSVDEGTVKFARTLMFQTKLVAPSVIVQKTASKTFKIINGPLSDYVYGFNTTGLDVLTNVITGEKMFEPGDNCTFISVTRIVTEAVIDTVSTDTIVTVNDFGSNGNVYIFTIESIITTLEEKNEVYFYDNNEGVL
jgi:hypothetical protein